MFTRHDLKILLVQLRKDDSMRDQEFRAVCRSGALASKQVTRINGLTDTMAPYDIKDYHALIIGGTGDYSIFADLPITRELEGVLGKAKAENYPVFGSCWGGQLMAQVLGGVVETDIEREEVGSYLVNPTNHAADDPLFFDAPNPFWAQIGHHESITKLPDGAQNLAGSERCEIQAFTWPGTTLYGLQLHADLNKHELIERVEHYREAYAADPALFNAIIDNAQASPYTDDLITKYLDRIVVPHWNAQS